MYRQKTIINRQRRNVSQIANVQRKVRQTDRPANTAENIDKVRPANTAKYRQLYRRISHDEDIDKVRLANTMQLSTIFNENIV